MRTFHEYWAYVLVPANLIAGIWGLAWVRRNPPAPRGFWPLVYAGQIAVGIQVVVGVLLTQTIEAKGRHMFYGFVLGIAAALIWAFRSSDEKRNITAFAAVALFIGAVGIRTMTTA